MIKEETKSYLGLNTGDIIKSIDNKFYVVIQPKSDLIVVHNFVRVKSLTNDTNMFTEIEGGKAGFKVYNCQQDIKVSGLDYLCKQWIAKIDLQ